MVRLVQLPTLLLTLLLSCVTVNAEEAPAIASIKDAWNARSKSLENSALEWTEERVHPKGQNLSPRDAEPLASDMTIKFEKKLIISGNKLRIQGKGKALDFRTKGLDPFEFTVVFNKTGSSFHNYPGQKHNLGYFTKSSGGLADVTYRPAMLATNPGSENFGRIKLDDYHVMADRAAIGGRSCVTLESNEPRSLEGTLYLDPERQFVVTRVISLDGARITRQIDLTYERDSRGIWFPASWEFKIMNPASDGYAVLISSTTKSFDSQYKATDDDFVIHYPPGTLIYDQRTPGDNRILVGEHGAQRPLSTIEHSSSLESLSATGTTKSSSRSWIILTNLLCVFIVTSVLLYRSYRRRPKPGE